MNQLILREAGSSYCFTEHTSLCLGLPASDLSVFGDCGENQIGDSVKSLSHGRVHTV